MSDYVICKQICKRTDGEAMVQKVNTHGLGSVADSDLPRKTPSEETSGDGVRRTFNPKVVGSIPTGPTSKRSSIAWPFRKSLSSAAGFLAVVCRRLSVEIHAKAS